MEKALELFSLLSCLENPDKSLVISLHRMETTGELTWEDDQSKNEIAGGYLLNCMAKPGAMQTFMPQDASQEQDSCGGFSDSASLLSLEQRSLILQSKFSVALFSFSLL